MDSTTLIELIKQGPATITLVALVFLAFGGFKYFSAFMAAAAAKDVEQRREFFELITASRNSIEGLARSVDRLGSGQERLAKAIESLACFETPKTLFAARNGRMK